MDTVTINKIPTKMCKKAEIKLPYSVLKCHEQQSIN